MIFGVKDKVFGLDNVITVIEVITLTGWLYLWLHGYYILSTVALYIGLDIEHIVATITGRIEGEK